MQSRRPFGKVQPETLEDQTKEEVVDGELKTVKVPPLNDSISQSALTLYGGAPHPKQLFSSLREKHLPSTRMSQRHKEPSNLFSNDIPTVPLQESGLPNGITTTKIVPMHSIEYSTKKKPIPTLGDLFAPTLNVQSLNPPVQSSLTTTRSSSVNWYNPTEPSTSVKTDQGYSYTKQDLKQGHWLTYNTAPSISSLSSPEAKRRQRDRALSFGETQPTMSDEVMAAHQRSKEEALFRSAYSSFAPIKDDAKAIVPEQTMSRLWWKRVGESKLQAMKDIDSKSSVDHRYASGIPALQSHDKDEDQLLKEAVESWTPEEMPKEFLISTDKVDDHGQRRKEIDDVLLDISEQIETLASYQKIRNLTLATNSRTSAGQNPQLTAMSGSPTSPSTGEFDIYEILKSQLSIVIASLPPYAVAKLNGNQLEALNISTRIPVEGKNYRGTMEEDEFTAKAARSATQATTGSAVRTATPTRANHYPQPVGTPGQRSSYANVPRPAPSATYPNQTYSARPPSSTYASNSQQSYTANRPPSASSIRPPYSTQGYGQQVPQSHNVNGHRPYPLQNGNSYSQHHSGAPHASPPASGQSTLQRPSQPGYQQRGMNSSSYNYSPLPTGRSASPGNLASNHVGTPTAAYHGQQRSQYYPSSSATPFNPSSLNSATGTVGQHLNISAEEQTILMDRQKAQIAHQQQIAMSNGRQGSGTPQPLNGHVGDQRNGTPVAQPNTGS